MDEVIAAEDTDSETNRRNIECEQAPCYSDEEIFQNSKFIHNTNKCTFIYTSTVLYRSLYMEHTTHPAWTRSKQCSFTKKKL